MSFFCYLFRHSEEVLDAFVSGILFTVPFCYTKLNSMRTIKWMIHDVGSGVVNALCVIESIKAVGICKIDKKRSKIQW